MYYITDPINSSFYDQFFFLNISDRRLFLQTYKSSKFVPLEFFFLSPTHNNDNIRSGLKEKKWFISIPVDSNFSLCQEMFIFVLKTFA